MPGLCRHYYDNHFWPEKIERCEDENILSWLEEHLCMIPMEPRKAGCSVVEGKDITTEKVKRLTLAADECWKGIMNMDLNTFVSGFRKSFDAQVAMFPAMIQGSVQSYIDKYSSIEDVLAWKMPGAGGGGYLVCVVNDASMFCASHSEAIALKVHRSGM